MLRYTRLGHHVYAIGGNRDVARMSGVRTSVPVIAAHVLCSLLAGLAALLLLSRTGVGLPTIGSQGRYDLLSIAAVVLGGTLLAGGKGSVVGTIGGVAIFAVIDNVMGVMQVNPFLKDFVRGLVIVLAVAVYARRSVVRRPPRFAATGPRCPSPARTRRRRPHEHRDLQPRGLRGRPHAPAHRGLAAAAHRPRRADPGWGGLHPARRPLHRRRLGQPLLRRAAAADPLHRPHRADRDRGDGPVLRHRRPASSTSRWAPSSRPRS